MSWSGGSSGPTRRLNTFLMSEDRWARALKEHNHRVKHVKPAVDLKSPWGCSRPYVPLPPPDELNHHHHSARSGRPISATSARGGGNNAAAAAAGGATGAGGSRPTSATSTGRRGGSAAPQRPMSAASRTSNAAQSARSGEAGGAGRPPTGAQVISHLPLQQQKLCEDMTKLLCGLDREQSKAVLEHLYSAAEEGRLLQSYSGVYPGLVTSNAADDKGFEDE